MPLEDYGVLLGTMAGYHRDAPNNFGKFFHGHIDVQTPGGLYNTAIDVDSERPGVQVQWKVLQLRSSEWQSIFSLSDGFHRLASTASSGAVDYYRDSRMQQYQFIVLPQVRRERPPWWRRLGDVFHQRDIPDIGPVAGPRLDTPLTVRESPALTFLSSAVKVLNVTPPWKTGTDVQALVDLEAMIVDAARVVIFGESYLPTNGRPPGLHDIHQNQGDPPGSFQHLDGIWQDGATIAIHSDGTAAAFINRFSTQSDRTDNNGLPLP